MNMREVFVVGAETMGSGIAREYAKAGTKGILNDIDQGVLNIGLKNIVWSVSKSIFKANTILNIRPRANYSYLILNLECTNT